MENNGSQDFYFPHFPHSCFEDIRVFMHMYNVGINVIRELETTWVITCMYNVGSAPTVVYG